MTKMKEKHPLRVQKLTDILKEAGVNQKLEQPLCTLTPSAQQFYQTFGFDRMASVLFEVYNRGRRDTIFPLLAIGMQLDKDDQKRLREVYRSRYNLLTSVVRGQHKNQHQLKAVALISRTIIELCWSNQVDPQQRLISFQASAGTYECNPEVLPRVNQLFQDIALLKEKFAEKRDRKLSDEIIENEAKVIRYLLKEKVDVDLHQARFSFTINAQAYENLSLIDAAARLDLQGVYLFGKIHEVPSTLPAKDQPALISTIKHALESSSNMIFNSEFKVVQAMKLLDVQDEEGNTLLHLTCMKPIAVEFFNLLYKANVDLEIQNKEGYTALLCAIKYEEIVKRDYLLLNKPPSYNNERKLLMDFNREKELKRFVQFIKSGPKPKPTLGLRMYKELKDISLYRYKNEIGELKMCFDVQNDEKVFVQKIDMSKINQILQELQSNKSEENLPQPESKDDEIAQHYLPIKEIYGDVDGQLTVVYTACSGYLSATLNEELKNVTEKVQDTNPDAIKQKLTKEEQEKTDEENRKRKQIIFLNYMIRICFFLDSLLKSDPESIPKDLKLENLVLTKNHQIKIVNFTNLLSNNELVNCHPFAPEVWINAIFKKLVKFGDKTLSWLIGIILYELLSYGSKIPFKNNVRMVSNILQNIYEKRILRQWPQIYQPVEGLLNSEDERTPFHEFINSLFSIWEVIVGVQHPLFVKYRENSLTTEESNNKLNGLLNALGIDPPEVDQEIKEKIHLAQKENRVCQVDQFKFDSYEERKTFSERILRNLESWITIIEKVTEKDKDQEIGFYNDELNFWSNLYSSLIKLQDFFYSDEEAKMVFQLSKVLDTRLFFKADRTMTRRLEQLPQKVEIIQFFLKIFKMTTPILINEAKTLKNLEENTLTVFQQIKEQRQSQTLCLGVGEANKWYKDYTDEEKTELQNNMIFKIYQRLIHCFLREIEKRFKHFIQGAQLFKFDEEEYSKFTISIEQFKEILQKSLNQVFTYKSQIIDALEYFPIFQRITKVTDFRKSNTQLQQLIEISFKEVDFCNPNLNKDRELEKQTLIALNEYKIEFSKFVKVFETDVEGEELWKIGIQQYKQSISKIEDVITDRIKFKMENINNNANQLFTILEIYKEVIDKPIINPELRKSEEKILELFQNEIDKLNQRFLKEKSIDFVHNQIKGLPEISSKLSNYFQLVDKLSFFENKLWIVQKLCGYIQRVSSLFRKSSNLISQIEETISKTYKQWYEEVATIKFQNKNQIKDSFVLKTEEGEQGNQILVINYDESNLEFEEEARSLQRMVEYRKSINTYWNLFRIELKLQFTLEELERTNPLYCSLKSSLRTFYLTIGKILPANAILIEQIKTDLIKELQKGLEIKWRNDDQLGIFSKKVVQSVLYFEEKVDLVNSKTKLIDNSLKKFSLCSSKEVEIENKKIQKIIDDFDIERFSNMKTWVQQLNEQMELIFAARPEIKQGFEPFIYKSGVKEDQYKIRTQKVEVNNSELKIEVQPNISFNQGSPRRRQESPKTPRIREVPELPEYAQNFFSKLMLYQKANKKSENQTSEEKKESE